MFVALKSKKNSAISLGKLRHFINEDCRSLSDDIPIDICISMSKGLKDFNGDCVEIIADDESMTFYNY